MNVFEYESGRTFIEQIVTEIKERNPGFSLRAFAAKTGVSASAISGFLNQKKTLSEDSVTRISQYLKLTKKEASYFSSIVQIDSLPKTAVKSFLQKDLARTTHSAVDADHYDRIINIRENSEAYRSYFYQSSDLQSSRMLTLLRDKKTKEPLSDFCDQFTSLNRMVASNSYFLRNSDGTYRSCLIQIKDGRFLPVLNHPKNTHLNVTFDDDGFPTISGVHMKILNTSLQEEAVIRFSKEKVTIQGQRFDESTPDERRPNKQVWLRNSVEN